MTEISYPPNVAKDIPGEKRVKYTHITINFMIKIDNEQGTNKTQFVYHNLFKDNEEGLAEIVPQILQQGLWSPVDYSTISPDIFFFGGGIHGAVTIICATPHQNSNEAAGALSPWKKVRLMEPDGRVYPPEDDAVPSNVRKIFAEKPNTVELAKKGFKHIPPPDLKAVIRWGNDAVMFRRACNEGSHKYTKAQATELEAVALIKSLSPEMQTAMEILDPSFSKEKVVTGIAKSVTRLSLTEAGEEILQVLADLKTGEIEKVNEYLAPFKDAPIEDKEELLRQIEEKIDKVRKIQPSYPDTKRVKEEYMARIFSDVEAAI